MSDIDVKSAYPTGTSVLNISKSTRAYELCHMGNLNTAKQRAVGINLSSITTNALEIVEDTHKFPPLDELLAEFKK